MADSFDCDLLIVGGGPTGVTLGLLAAQNGLKVIICEKEEDIYPLPRAAHVDHEVMRIFQSVGAAEAIMETSRQTTHYDFLTADRQILLRFEGADRIGAGGWPAANMIHQPSVERALRDRLVEYPGVELRSSWQFESFAEDSDGITAEFATDGGVQSLTCKWLVGADGARSPVRNAAGIECDDLNFDELWLVVDAIVHDYSRLPPVNLQICDPQRPTTCVLMGNGRHRWEFMVKPGETAADVLDDQFIEELLDPWNVAGAITLERKVVYRFNAKVAQAWRKGRVLLAGDAAHQTPPFAGQGMCAGIRDAANLAWKLGRIVRGQATPDILDTYQTEREPHVRATIGMAMMMGQTVCITDPAAAAERDRAMLEARAAGQSPDGDVTWPAITNGMIFSGSPEAGGYFPQFLNEEGARLDDILGEGEWLFGDTKDAVPTDGLRHFPLDCDIVRPFAKMLSDWLDEKGVRAVLVRPDRHIFGTGSATILAKAWVVETKIL